MSSILVQTCAGLARAAAVSAGSLFLAMGAIRLTAHRRGRLQSLLWMLLVAPCLMPSFLIGYAWARAILALTMQPGWNELVYTAALVLRLMPVAALALYFLPPALSAEARHCHRLLKRPRRSKGRPTHTSVAGRTGRSLPNALLEGLRPTQLHPAVCAGKGPPRPLPCALLAGRRSGAVFSDCRFALASLGAGAWIAFSLVFLLCFGEFELAAMWSLKTWPVLLFDAQAGGLPLGETLRLAAAPAALQALLLAALAATARPRSQTLPGTGVRRLSPLMQRALWLYLLVAAGAAVFCPLGLVLGDALGGFSSLWGNALLIRDIGTSLFFAGGAALLCWSLSGFPNRSHRAYTTHGAYKTTAGERSAWLFGAPGMLGGLVLALLLLAAFQSALLHALYDTPVPLLMALTLLLLPLALCLRWLSAATRPAPALHIARMLNSRPLLWQLEGRRRWWSLFLLFCWGYFEFTASTLLAPIGMTPVMARLHNLAHYGQTAVLSAMICAAVLAPLVVLLLTATGRHLYARLRGHSSHLETGSRLPGTRPAPRPLA